MTSRQPPSSLQAKSKLIWGREKIVLARYITLFYTPALLARTPACIKGDLHLHRFKNISAGT